MTRDEVVKALECCILRDPDDRPRCGDCPYPSGSACSNRLKADALALLKQEPKRGEWLLVADYCYDDRPAWDCSECEAMVSRQYNYCPRCGAKMEKEGDAK